MCIRDRYGAAFVSGALIGMIPLMFDFLLTAMVFPMVIPQVGTGTFPDVYKRQAHYYGIILIFAIGAGIGGVCSLHIGIRAIWASSVLLAIVLSLIHI